MRCAIQNGEVTWKKLSKQEQRDVLRFCTQTYEKELKRQVDETETFTEKVMLGLCLIAMKRMNYDEEESFRLLSRMRHIKVELSDIHSDSALRDYLHKNVPNINAYENVCKIVGGDDDENET